MKKLITTLLLATAIASNADWFSDFRAQQEQLRQVEQQKQQQFEMEMQQEMERKLKNLEFERDMERMQSR